jgi:hypothetical protein
MMRVGIIRRVGIVTSCAGEGDSKVVHLAIMHFCSPRFEYSNPAPPAPRRTLSVPKVKCNLEKKTKVLRVGAGLGGVTNVGEKQEF